MDFLELATSRRSVRSYQSRHVEQDKLDRILEAVRLAPSGSNRQPWRFVIVRDAGVRRRLVAACANQQFIAQAPVAVSAGTSTSSEDMPLGRGSPIVGPPACALWLHHLRSVRRRCQ
jgi:nitroreductase